MDTPKLRTYVHSNDFERTVTSSDHAVNGKTRDEWETEHEVSRYMAALKDFGWIGFYQWRWQDVITKPGAGRGCFAEIFSPLYGGYLRGDGKTLKEAFHSCLVQAEKMAKCERTVGHSWKVIYENGCVVCEHCRFGGYSPEYKELSSRINTLEIHRDVLQQQNAKLWAVLKMHNLSIGAFVQDPEANDGAEDEDTA